MFKNSVILKLLQIVRYFLLQTKMHVCLTRKICERMNVLKLSITRSCSSLNYLLKKAQLETLVEVFESSQQWLWYCGLQTHKCNTKTIFISRCVSSLSYFFLFLLLACLHCIHCVFKKHVLLTYSCSVCTRPQN